MYIHKKKHTHYIYRSNNVYTQEKTYTLHSMTMYIHKKKHTHYIPCSQVCFVHTGLYYAYHMEIYPKGGYYTHAQKYTTFHAVRSVLYILVCTMHIIWKSILRAVTTHTHKNTLHSMQSGLFCTYWSVLCILYGSLS